MTFFLVAIAVAFLPAADNPGRRRRRCATLKGHREERSYGVLLGGRPVPRHRQRQSVDQVWELPSNLES
ncbi:MAG: hypothetical protein U0736_25655 [Gemmataceae bacterium]